MAPQRCVISCASLLAALLVVLTAATGRADPPHSPARCTANLVCDNWKACISALAANPHRRAEFDNVRAHGKEMAASQRPSISGRPGIVAKPGSILTDVLGWSTCTAATTLPPQSSQNWASKSTTTAPHEPQHFVECGG
jgi:hypothetical protein